MIHNTSIESRQLLNACAFPSKIKIIILIQDGWVTMNDVLTVADALLKIAKRHGKGLTPMQLMKLTYLAHGWSLAIRSRGLFRNKIEAWQYGPIIPDLYHATRSHGLNPIPLEIINENDIHQIQVSDDDRSFLSSVFDKYGHLDGVSLSYLTSQSGSPWDQIYRLGAPDIVIPDDLISQHYSERAHSTRRRPAKSH